MSFFFFRINIMLPCEQGDRLMEKKLWRGFYGILQIPFRINSLIFGV